MVASSRVQRWCLCFCMILGYSSDCFLSFKTHFTGQGLAAWCSYNRSWSYVNQMLFPMLINVPVRSHEKLLAASSAACSFQHAVKQSAISKLTICRRWEDPTQKELKETEKGNAKMWDTCVWFTWCDYQRFRFRTCWLIFAGVLGRATASNNPWNKGRMFGLSCDKFLTIILRHGTQWS